MAAKKESGPLRSAKLVKKAVASAKERLFSTPEPMPAGLARKMKLPNGESLSSGLKELFLADTTWIGIDYDDEEAEIESISLEDVVEETFGKEAVAAFGEAYELLGEDCVAFGASDLSRPACLYIGEVDEAGEYPVLQLEWEKGKPARIGGFIPFDVWLAQELGALERGKDIGDVPAEYSALPKMLAESNFDGRVVFEPTAGEPSDDDDEDEDEDKDEDEDDEDEDDEDEDDDATKDDDDE